MKKYLVILIALFIFLGQGFVIAQEVKAEVEKAKATIGSPCTSGTDCQSGFCSGFSFYQCTDGSNGSNCAEGTDCQSGNCSSNGVCAFKDPEVKNGEKLIKAKGYACEKATDCQSGNCASGICL